MSDAEIKPVEIPKEQLTGRARRLANLCPPFKKGEVHNPHGRPKGICIGDYLRKHLIEICPNDPKGRSWGEVIATRMMVEAAKGDIAAAKEIEDRVAGKSKQSLDIVSTEKKPSFDFSKIAITDRIAILQILTNAKQTEPDGDNGTGEDTPPAIPAGNP